jgi:hypothetical protein
MKKSSMKTAPKGNTPAIMVLKGEETNIFENSIKCQNERTISMGNSMAVPHKRDQQIF